MSNTANARIREAAKAAGIRLWQVAEKYGISDGNFSRKLRRELSEEERNKILEIIHMLAAKSEQEAS